MGDHNAEVLAALRSDPNLNVHDGPAPKGTPPPYVNCYVYFGRSRRERLNQTVTDRTPVFINTHCVAASKAGADIQRARVQAILLDRILHVDGAQCSPITHEAGYPARWDETTGVRLMDAIDEWDYTARPA